MALQIKSNDSKKSNVILLPFGKDAVDKSLIAKYSGITYDVDFDANAKEVVSLMHVEKKIKCHLLGLGNGKDNNKTHTFFRSFIFQQRSKNDLVIDVICDHLTDDQLSNAIIGLRLGLVNHGIFKTNGNKFVEPEITVIIDIKRHNIAKEALKVAETQVSIMQLVDHPSNLKTPMYISKFASNSGKKNGFEVTVFDTKELKKMGMEALLAVGQGSANPPVLIVMEYKPKGMKSKSPKLGLVGKGISFDTGGISIKPSTNMGYMKCDMGGAAAVIGAIELAAKLNLNIHLVGVVPSAENSVDANSIRPGDVIGSYSGKSIEVIDTDAEGRLVLADGIAYINKHYDPEYLIDLAT